MAKVSTDDPVHTGIYPMVPVPDALQMVLEETAKRLALSPAAHWEDECELNQLIDGAMGHRILAQPVRVPSPGYPVYNASIMDGYAIHCICPPENETDNEGSASTLQNDGWTHCIVQSIYAGDDPAPQYPGEGEATATQDSFASLSPTAYITTGAAVPDEYNCVIPIENCTVDATRGKLKFTGRPKPGMWIRPVGCDMKADSCILQAGDTLDAVAIGLLVQLGVRKVRVRRRPKVRLHKIEQNKLILTSFPL
jgi:molybdopterin biosynthesis enzyme